MWIVNPENRNTALNPEPDHIEQRLHQSLLIRRVEINWIYILVFLGWVLGILNRAVWPMLEPLRMLSDPWMVGGALHGEVQCHFDSEPTCGGNQAIEIGQGAQRRLYRGMPAGFAADCPGTADAVACAVGRIVGALAVGAADRMDRRQIYDIETHLVNVGQPMFGVGERACTTGVRRLGADEQLIP